MSEKIKDPAMIALILNMMFLDDKTGIIKEIAECLYQHGMPGDEILPFLEDFTTRMKKLKDNNPFMKYMHL